MSLARRAPRGCAAVARALLGVAVAASGFAGIASLASPASAQEEAAAPTATPPPAFEFDRAVGPLAFEVAFKLADKDEAHLQILFDEPDERSELSCLEREIFGMDFQPFEGARFVLSRSTINAPLVSSLLAQVPEPKDLEFKLRIELPQEGGLAVTMADGMPVVIARTPRARRMKVQFAASGGVVAFTATKAERATKLGLDAAGETAMAGFLAITYQEKVNGGRPFNPTLGPNLLRSNEVASPAKQVRSVDRQEQAGVVIERYVFEFEEGVESPLLLTRNPGDDRLPVLLCIAGGPQGCTEASILAALGSPATSRTAVAAFELIGTGERRSTMPHDDLRVPELELVGVSSFDLATIEAMQVMQWLRGRPDVDGTKVGVAGSGVGSEVAERLARPDAAVKVEKLPTGTPLPVEIARVGDDYLHLRFDSCQLERALTRRDELPAPDTTTPLKERLGTHEMRRGMVFPYNAIVFNSGSAPQRWDTHQPAPPLRKHVTVVTSDRGRRVALEEAVSRLDARDEETLVSIELPRYQPFAHATDDFDLEFFYRDLAKVRGTTAEPPRVFADGAVAVTMIAAIVRDEIAIGSFTAVHAIPSFDLLLARPYRAHRADDSLDVLTQGMPYELFVPDVLERWEIEDAALALQERGVKIDWQDPVDSLRRPLTRHDRLAMWPRVRHAEFVR